MYDLQNEINTIEKNISSKLWEYDTYYKVRKIYLQNKWCARFTWIKNGVVMKEVFKAWKINFTLSPQIKVEWKGPLSWNNVQWIIDNNYQIQENMEHHK
jgi:hypothetical protein